MVSKQSKKIKDPKVGVVILAYNARDYILPCITSLASNTYPNFEVVLVDNGSDDNTTELVKSNFPQIKVILGNKKFGFSKANNIAMKFLIEKRKCDYILLLNDDTTCSKHLISGLVSPFLSDPSIGFVSPIMTYYENPQIVWFAGGYFNKLFLFAKHPHMDRLLRQVNVRSGKTDWVTFACVLISKKVIEKIGYMDERYGYYFMDVFYCLKAAKVGLSSFLVAAPLLKHRVSMHFGRGSNILTNRRAYYFARNPLLYLKNELKNIGILGVICGQLFIRLPHYTLQAIKQGNVHVLRWYLLGLKDGLLAVFGKRIKSMPY